MESKYPISTPSGPVTTLAIKNRRHTNLNRLRISISKTQSNRKKVRRDLWVDGKQRAGRGCGEIPLPISVPISTPTTCAITAPGPKMGDKNGILQINDNTNKPGSVPASGVQKMRYDISYPWSRNNTYQCWYKIMKGSTVCRIISTVSLPAWNNTAVTLPKPLPKLRCYIWNHIYKFIHTLIQPPFYSPLCNAFRFLFNIILYTFSVIIPCINMNSSNK